MILPRTLWDLPDDSVAVEIDGVTFLETPEEAARLVAEGVAKLLTPAEKPAEGAPQPSGTDAMMGELLDSMKVLATDEARRQEVAKRLV